MALPMLKGCYCSRLSSAFNITRSRISKTQSVVLSRSSRTRLPLGPLHAGGVVAAGARPYSSDQEGQKLKQNVMVVGVPNPLIWFRTRIYFFLIRAYFDREFNIEEFAEGAKQAFSHVSRLLSQCQFEALEGLVAKDLVGQLERKCKLLPLSHRKALSADPDEIMYTNPYDVCIFYDDNGRKFVSILMRFWYLTSARLPEDALEEIRVFKVAFGEGESKRLLTANYEFQREFTKGVLPDWTITRIEHSKLFD